MSGKGSPSGAPELSWLSAPQPHDFAAASAYLLLVFRPATVASLVKDLRHGVLTCHKAKDLLRAAQLTLLDRANPHVAGDLTKVARGEPLSPILLVRGDAGRGRPLVIADGYHRVCASYHLAENSDIPAVLIDRP